MCTDFNTLTFYSTFTFLSLSSSLGIQIFIGFPRPREREENDGTVDCSIPTAHDATPAHKPGKAVADHLREQRFRHPNDSARIFPTLAAALVGVAASRWSSGTGSAAVQLRRAFLVRTTSPRLQAARLRKVRSLQNAISGRSADSFFGIRLHSASLLLDHDSSFQDWKFEPEKSGYYLLLTNCNTIVPKSGHYLKVVDTT
jgi:hypothetical protein